MLQYNFGDRVLFVSITISLIVTHCLAGQFYSFANSDVDPAAISEESATAGESSPQEDSNLSEFIAQEIRVLCHQFLLKRTADDDASLEELLDSEQIAQVQKICNLATS